MAEKGLAQTVLDSLGVLGTALSSMFNKALEVGEDFEKDHTKKLTFPAKTEDGEDVEIVVRVDPQSLDSAGKKITSAQVNITYDGQHSETQNISDGAQLKNFLLKYAKKYKLQIDEEGLKKLSDSKEASTNASVHVSLKRVVGSVETAIELVAIDPHCCPSTTRSLLNDVCQSDEFCASVPETPTCYIIKDEDTTYDIEPTDQPVDTSATYIEVLRASALLLDNLQFMKWNAHGLEYDNIRKRVEDFRWGAEHMMDVAAQCACSELARIPSACELLSEWCPHLEKYQCEGRNAYKLLHDWVSSYVDTLHLFACNWPPMYQRMIDETLTSYEEELVALQKVLE